MNSVSVIIEHSKLKREVYYFWLENEYHLWLDSYYIEERETSRHKFKTKDFYNRLERSSTIKEGDVILSPEVIRIAINNLIKQIKVEKWSERR